jgi:hypothetical protein
MKHRTRGLAGLAAAALVLLAATTAFGYAGEVAGAVTVGGPGGTLQCGVPITVSATIVDSAGKPIEGQPVDWTIASSPSSADTINATPTTTDANGVATTTVTLACVAGNREIRATADGVSGGAVLGVTAAGLPRTSTVPGEVPVDVSLVATLLAVLAVLAGGGTMVRRLVLNPR